MKFKKIAAFFVFAGAGFYFVRAYQPSIKMMYPQECAFLIDDQFSQSFQKKLQDHALQAYKQTRDPEVVIESIAHTFPEVHTMDAYLCKTDKVCFTFDGARPLFTLNDALVVCNNQQAVVKDCYREDVLHNLFGIKSKDIQSLPELITFYTSVHENIFREFNVAWNNEDEIILQTKSKRPDNLFFSNRSMPTQDDICLFKKIQKKEQLKSKKIKKSYDFRFKNQIIIR